MTEERGRPGWAERLLGRRGSRHTGAADMGAMGADAPALVCRGIDVAYDKVQVLFGVDLEVQEGEIIALLGTNGAGKSTLLKAISGLVDPIAGTIVFNGRDITHAEAVETSKMGIIQVPGARPCSPPSAWPSTSGPAPGSTPGKTRPRWHNGSSRSSSSSPACASGGTRWRGTCPVASSSSSLWVWPSWPSPGCS